MSRWLPGELEARQCRGKLQYSSGQEAGKAKDGLHKRFRPGMQVYRCPHCHHWHIGRPSPNGNPKARYSRFKPPPPIPDWI